ncbi:MAG: pilin [Minisyncoccia bacterium]
MKKINKKMELLTNQRKLATAAMSIVLVVMVFVPASITKNFVAEADAQSNDITFLMYVPSEQVGGAVNPAPTIYVPQGTQVPNGYVPATQNNQTRTVTCAVNVTSYVTSNPCLGIYGAQYGYTDTANLPSNPNPLPAPGTSMSSIITLPPVTVTPTNLTYVPLEPLPNVYTDENGSASSFIPLMSGLLTLAIIIGGVLAVARFSIGGVIFMTSDVVGNRAKAKSQMWASVWGLLLLICSVLILKTINPELVNFNFVNDLNALQSSTPATNTTVTQSSTSMGSNPGI